MTLLNAHFLKIIKFQSIGQGGGNATGLLKYIAFFISNYLNAIDMAPHDGEEDMVPRECNLQMRPSFKIDMIVVLLSDQFTNKRYHASHKRKSSKTVIVKVKPEIYGLNDAFINNHSSAGNVGEKIILAPFISALSSLHFIFLHR
jgi:hypothetical protein